MIGKTEYEVNDMSDNYMDLGQRLEEDFAEIDNDIVADLRERSEEYAALHRQISNFKARHPFIGRLWDRPGEVHLTAEEHAALMEYFKLQYKLDTLERQQLYFRGHTDAIAYLKKVNAI